MVVASKVYKHYCISLLAIDSVLIIQLMGSNVDQAIQPILP